MCHYFLDRRYLYILYIYINIIVSYHNSRSKIYPIVYAVFIFHPNWLLLFKFFAKLKSTKTNVKEIRQPVVVYYAGDTLVVTQKQNDRMFIPHIFEDGGRGGGGGGVWGWLILFTLT